MQFVDYSKRKRKEEVVANQKKDRKKEAGDSNGNSNGDSDGNGVTANTVYFEWSGNIFTFGIAIERRWTVVV